MQAEVNNFSVNTKYSRRESVCAVDEAVRDFAELTVCGLPARKLLRKNLPVLKSVKIVYV